MTNYRTGSAGNMENPLCEQLRREFRGRGLNAVRAERAETSVMLERVKRGLDPYENAPDPTKRTVSAVPRTNAARRPASAPAKTAARPGAKVAAWEAAPAKRSSAAPAAVRQNRSAAVAARRIREKARVEEVRVRSPFPLAAVSLLTVFTLMFMVLTFSLTQNYELSSEISALQSQARELAQLERDLSVQLEERDDIRVIENIAVNELGMVKNDLVESRFVSVSGGDRIELTEEQEDAVRAGLWSTMLSAIGENLGRLREYIE